MDYNLFTAFSPLILDDTLDDFCLPALVQPNIYTNKSNVKISQLIFEQFIFNYSLEPLSPVVLPVNAKQGVLISFVHFVSIMGNLPTFKMINY